MTFTVLTDTSRALLSGRCHARGLKHTPPCRVQRSSEPAFAGWDPPRELRLGSGLSRHAREIGSRYVGVGSGP